MNDRDYEKEIENLNKDATRLLELHKKTIKEKEELQLRIDKAIEYIEKNGHYDFYNLDCAVDGDVLLEILKGVNKE